MQKTLILSVGLAALSAATIATAMKPRGAVNSTPAQNIVRDAAAQNSAATRDAHDVFSADSEVRSFDGSGNNEAQPLAGATFQPLVRVAGADYADGVSAMAAPWRKSPREISNIVVRQGDQSFPNTFGTSDFLWQWGQFMDHDFALSDGVVSDDRSFDIPVPAGDPFFDPAGLGDRTIHFDRSIFDAGSGDGVDNPRQQINEITSWIDGSQVYGSSDERARALRTLDGTGKLKTSAGDLLPFNTEILPNANGEAPDPTKLFLAGDVRSNEQVGLTTMHTLFVREHNRWAMQIGKMRPWLSGDDIYHEARRMVVAEIQIITYTEFLPALIGDGALPAYKGYTPGNPGLLTEFSGAAYRLGHTLINSRLMRLDAKGNEIPAGHLSLRNAFFNAPTILKKRSDIDPILRGLAAQRSQRFDSMIVDDLRNFLFGPPGAGGFDLASLNIQRGRDRGIASYNDVREAYGLPRVEDFDDVTSDAGMQARLAEAYGDVDDIDLWIGGLSEDALVDQGSQLGPLFREIVSRQFAMLRDMDRFWWQRDLSPAEQAMVKNTTLADIIVANTDIKRNELPRDVFYVRD